MSGDKMPKLIPLLSKDEEKLPRQQRRALERKRHKLRIEAGTKKRLVW